MLLWCLITIAFSFSRATCTCSVNGFDMRLSMRDRTCSDLLLEHVAVHIGVAKVSWGDTISPSFVNLLLVRIIILRLLARCYKFGLDLRHKLGRSLLHLDLIIKNAKQIIKFFALTWHISDSYLFQTKRRKFTQLRSVKACKLTKQNWHSWSN